MRTSDIAADRARKRADVVQPPAMPQYAYAGYVVSATKMLCDEFSSISNYTGIGVTAYTASA